MLEVLSMEEKRYVTIKFWILKEKRKERKLTQLEMSEMLGISLRQYKNYENGFVKMTKKRVMEICDIIEIGYNEILHLDFEYECIKEHNARKKEYLDKLASEFKAYHKIKSCNMPKLRYILNNNNLSDIRRKSGHSAVDVSELLGISRQTYARYEKEQCTVSEDVLSKLCILFEIEKEDIVSCDIHEMLKKSETERLNALIERTNEIKKEYEDVVDEVNIDFKGKILFAFV